jgi:hypothetical protein
MARIQPVEFSGTTQIRLSRPTGAKRLDRCVIACTTADEGLFLSVWLSATDPTATPNLASGLRDDIIPLRNFVGTVLLDYDAPYVVVAVSTARAGTGNPSANPAASFRWE